MGQDRPDTVAWNSEWVGVGLVCLYSLLLRLYMPENLSEVGAWSRDRL